MSAEENEVRAGVDERAVAAALAELRPQPGPFRAGVEQRLAELRARREAESREAERSPLARAAAGVLPAGLLRGEAAAPAAAGLVWKALALLALLPAASLTVLFLGSWTFASSRGGLPDRTLRGWQEAVGAWWRAHAGKTALTVVLLAVLAATQPFAAAAGLVVTSCALLVQALGRLRTAGFEDRGHVGRHAAILLTLVLEALALTFTPFVFLPVAVPHAHASFLLLSLGAIACIAASLSARYGSPWRLLVAATPLDALLLLAALVLAPVSVHLGREVWRDAAPSTPARRAAAALEAMEPARGWVPWSLAAELVEWMRASAAAPDVAPLRARWDADAGSRPVGELLAAGLRLGFARGEEAAARMAGELRAVLATPGPVAAGDPRKHPELWLLARGALSAAERAHLRARLERSFPTAPGPGMLERAAGVLALLEELDAGASAPLAEDARRLVSASADTGGWPAWIAVRPPPFPLPLWRDAVEILRWSGVPAGLGSRRLADSLARATRPALPWGKQGWLELSAMRSLDLLRNDIAPPLLRDRLLDRGFLGAVALLVALCVHATLRAPVTGD